jgi:FMN reductase
MSIKIVGVDGAVREGSKTRALLEVTGEAIVRNGGAFDWLSQATEPLPIFDGKSQTAQHPAVQRLFALSRDADAFILSSPEYHGSMSGALKNALDWMTSDFGGVDVSGKLFGLVGGGGAMGNSGAIVQMMMAVRSMHGWVMPDVMVSATNIWEAVESSPARIVDDKLMARVDVFAAKVVGYASRFQEMRLRMAA